MAFSFRAGTNWCHDFPKLARESGFCFNIHRTRVRVDWNRISSIDIDRVIRERDFSTVDDNVNNVVDYSLESEYDVKILDPNFVKLFRLAQLSVEYLLYCKQYLDHSVIILKDELRLKIEDNASMKKEIKTLEETIKDLNQRMKERNRIIESKLGDSNGELFKCPHCTKTFIAATFVSAHIARRHRHLNDPYMPAASPIHEQYRVETEKLHNEIKTLKERLNETERVIRNESEKTFDCGRNDSSFYKTDAYEKGEFTIDREREDKLKEQQIKYQDEITSLKNMLFTEIRNLKQKDRSVSPIYQIENETNMMNLKELIKKQEKEIHGLRDQLREKLTPDLKNVQEKLKIQEQHWKVMNERLEREHNFDTENLSTRLKMSQDSAREMKELYESKINELETHSKSQSKMLEAQGMQLKRLSRDLLQSREINEPSFKEKEEMNSPNKLSSRDINKKMTQSSRDVEEGPRSNLKINKHEELICEDVGSLSSHESPKISTSPNQITKHFLRNEDRVRLLSGNGDFETSGDTESVRNRNNNNNELITRVTNGKEHEIEKELDIENDKRNLVENLNLQSLQSSRRNKIIHQSSQKNNYKENIPDTFGTNRENQIQRNRKHRPNVTSQNSKSYKSISDTGSLNQGSKSAIKNMKSEQNLHSYKIKQDEKISNEKVISKLNSRQKSMEEEPEDSEDYSETESESDSSESESETISENENTEIINPNLRHTEDSNSRENLKVLINDNSEILQELNTHLKEVFDNKLRDLGIDPEWNGIPNATFKQKIETVAHHQNINSKKMNGYNRMRQKILKEIPQKLFKKRAEPSTNIEKMSPLDKIMSKVKIKTANVLKNQQKSGIEHRRTPVLKSQVISSRDRASRTNSNLEILPKKIRESDFNEMRNEKSNESLQKRNPEHNKPRVRPISVRNTGSSSQMKPGIFDRKQSSGIVDEIAMDSISSEQSQNGIEYLSETNSVSKARKSTLQSEIKKKVTSTPNKSSANNIIEQSYSSIDEFISSDNELMDLERARSLPVSPKNNKSVLKSATGSVGSLVKKKVLFDLEQSLENEGKSSDKDNKISEERQQPVKKLFPEYDFRDEKTNDDDWNISNLSDDDGSLQKEKSPSAENIVLKTSQSDNIARISKKIQDQLSISRQKPVGAIEAMFMAKPRSKGSEKDNNHYRSSTSIASSILESPKNQFVAKNFMESNNKAPKPAPRMQRNHESDIESDIEELLQME